MSEAGQPNDNKMDVEPVSIQLHQLKIIEKPSPALLEVETESCPAENEPMKVNVEEEMETKSDVAAPPPESLPTVLIVIGMAGSGKTTLTSKLISYLMTTGQLPYVVNLDPACRDPPYGVNIDIRDTVDYKQVMKGNGLGPNGAIVTSLNLFATKFDTVLDFLQKRGKTTKYIVIDTPGQIEVFMWSASGSIITELLASNFPTVMIYVTDLLATKSPISFMSNMSYACSILYKTKLPLVIALNKCDLESADTVKTWITDIEAFQRTLQDYKGYSVNLASSLSLVLDDFYENIQHTPVSAVTGEGIADLIKSIQAGVVEYNTIYKVQLQKMREKTKAKLSMPRGSKKASGGGDEGQSFVFSLPGSSDGGLGLSLTLDEESDEPESEEEDRHTLMDEEDDQETIGQVYTRESHRRQQMATEGGPSQSKPPLAKKP